MIQSSATDLATSVRRVESSGTHQLIMKTQMSIAKKTKKTNLVYEISSLHTMRFSRISSRRFKRFICILALISLTWIPATQALDWSDYVLGGTSSDRPSFQTKTLTMGEIREMRVRDIKRRLSRTHGYSADELGRMIDKKELIQALAFEEHKEREKELDAVKRYVVIRGIMIAIGVIAFVMGWPVWVHLYEVGSVNTVVYIDKKKHEASRCVELRSALGIIGVLLMAVLDIMQMWLSLSVLLSWFTSSQYFFPIPNLSVRPAQFMGEKVARGPLSKYGVNVGPMAITWAMRFAYGQIEAFTGRALSRAYQKQKKAARDWESPEDRAARKAAKKAAKKAAREEAEQRKQEAEREEEIRRKEAADKATAALFPPSMRTEPAPSNPNPMHQQVGAQGFEQDMDRLDMDDLD